MNLKELSEKSLKEAYRLEVCLPSDYIEIFSKNGIHEDINNLVKEEILKDYKKSKKRIEEVEGILGESKQILEDSINCSLKNKEEIKNMKQRMTILLEHINTLNKEMHIEELTNVYNRKWLFNVFLNNDKFTKEGTIVFLDLNGFKFINDNYGHHIGDETLRFFATFLKNNFKDSSIIRYAGDEFIIFNKRKNFEKEIKDSLNKLKKIKLRTKDKKSYFKLSFSYGFKYVKENDLFENVFKEIDKDMYKNKNKK
jgi:diguanylate cyclase (GGDEF)-like protein